MNSENDDQVYLDKIVKRLYRNLNGVNSKYEKEELKQMGVRENIAGSRKRLKSHQITTEDKVSIVYLVTVEKYSHKEPADAYGASL